MPALSPPCPDAKPLPMPRFVPHPLAAAQPDRYLTLEIRVADVLEAWRLSILAHAHLERDGRIKPDQALSPERLERRQHVRACLASDIPVETPILGIGIYDTLEIGAGADTLTTLALAGIKTAPVHALASQKNEFRLFLA